MSNDSPVGRNVLKAFHGDPAIKQKYLDRVRAHRAAGNLIQGTGWENGKGGAVGCTLEKYDHAAYETELGIPEWLAKVEERFFDNMPGRDAMAWPERFLSAIPVGADLEQVKAPFLIYVLECALEKFDHSAYPDCKNAITTVIELYRRGETDVKKFRQAQRAARAMAAATWTVAEERGEWARAAARAAAVTAMHAAHAGMDAAAWAVANAASRMAWAAEHKRFADKLIELMSALDAGGQ